MSTDPFFGPRNRPSHPQFKALLHASTPPMGPLSGNNDIHVADERIEDLELPGPATTIALDDPVFMRPSASPVPNVFPRTYFPSRTYFPNVFPERVSR